MTSTAEAGVSGEPISLLGVKQIFRSSSKLSAANILGGGLAALANILVARRLGPDDLGVIGLIQLWLLYASFLRPGMMQAGYREMLHLMGQNREKEALHVSNVALTAELGALLLPVILMASAGAFWYSDRRLRIGMAIGIVTFLATSVFQFVDTLQWAYQRFSLITRVSFIQKIVQPLILVAAVYALGLYGALAAPAAAAGIAVAYYLTRTAAIQFTPTWDGPLASRLVKIGLPLSLYGFLYWGFRTSDRAMVASWLTFKELGYFTFAMMFITQGCQLVSDFLNVFQANLFSELGKVGRVRPLAGKLQRISLLILLLMGFSAGGAQALFQPIVTLVVPKFVPGVPAFEVLVLNLVCTTAPLLAYSVLTSAVMDRQNFCAAIQLLGLGLNVALGWWFVKLGWGISGIAWSSALSQLAVAAAAYATLHPHVFEGAPLREPLKFYLWAAGLVGLTVGLHFSMKLGPFSFSSGFLETAFLRMLLVCVLWGAASAGVYRFWWKHRLTH